NASPRGNRTRLARHGLARGESDRLQFAGEQHDIRDAQFVLHLFLLSEEQHVFMQPLLYRQPFGSRTVRPVTDHQKFGGNLLSHHIKDLDRIGHTFYRTKIRKMHQDSLTVGRIFFSSLSVLLAPAIDVAINEVVDRSEEHTSEL